MRYTLTLRPDAWVHDGPVADRTGPVIGYKVGGMSDGEWARIANDDHPRNHWQILRIKGDTQGDWTGHYGSAEEALAALQKEYE